MTNVVWCTGFRQVFDWIDLPILGPDGWPREYRGVVGGSSRPVLLRTGDAVRLQLDGPAGRGTGRGVRRQPDQPSSRAEVSRRLSERSVASGSGGCAVNATMKLQQAHDALARRDWAQANVLLRALDDLDADDTMALATSAYLVGDVDAAVRVWQAAYAERVRAADDVWVRFGWPSGSGWSSVFAASTRWPAVGWRRAQRLLADQPEDIVERGYLLIHEFYGHLGRGDFGRAADTAGQIADVGRRFEDPDLIAQGLMSQGRMLIYSGRVSDGLALLDEAMVGLAADEVSPVFAGMVYCSLIEACQELSDYARAVSWTRALATWCDAQPGLVPFTGQCSVHKGQVLRLHGEWEEALAEFATAERRYAASNPPSAAGGLAFVERGDVLRIRGEFDLAEEAYGRAAALGREPQPGLTLLWVARGRTTQALSAVRRMLADPRPIRWLVPPSSGRGRGAGRRRTAGRRPPSRRRVGCDRLFVRLLRTAGDGGVRIRERLPGGRRSRGCVEPGPRILPPVARPRLSVRGRANAGAGRPGTPRVGRRGVGGRGAHRCATDLRGA